MHAPAGAGCGRDLRAGKFVEGHQCLVGSGVGQQGELGGPLRVPGQAVLRPLRHPGLAGRRGRTPSTRRSPRPTRPAIRSSSRPRCRSAAAARPAASSWPTTPTRCARTPANILGMDIKGHVVKRVWVEHASDIAEEYYASFTLDRGAKKHLLMLSRRGRRRDRGGGRDRSRRDRHAAHRPGRRALAGRRRARRAVDAKLDAAAVDGAADMLGEAVPTASPRATATWPRSTR